MSSYGDPMRGIAIGPANRPGRPVVVANVAHDLAAQIGHRANDTTGDQSPLHLREPEFDLVEPGGIGRCEVQGHAGRRRQELYHSLGLVSGEIIQNDVDLGTPWLPPDD